MNRKEFIKNSLAGAAGVIGSKAVHSMKNENKTSTYDKLMDQVGFNHLPNKEEVTMKSVLHKAETRGHANHGWLDTHHSFSFANYYNPDRMNFGVLRVLNDDVVDGGRGFARHPHDNMEIISIPLDGDLEHQDNMGNKAIIQEGDIQVMSAGTGIYHSEKNKNSNKQVKFLQIWLFPKQRGVAPRYDQLSMKAETTVNQLNQVLSPTKDDAGVWIHQDAWFHMGEFNQHVSTQYELKKAGNGIYSFVIEGEVKINGQELSRRDGYGVWDTSSIDIETTSGSKILIMEVPMQV